MTNYMCRSNRGFKPIADQSDQEIYEFLRGFAPPMHSKSGRSKLSGKQKFNASTAIWTFNNLNLCYRFFLDGLESRVRGVLLKVATNIISCSLECVFVSLKKLHCLLPLLQFMSTECFL